MQRTGASLIVVGVLAFWLGAAALFTLVVAPAVFAVLPTRTLAGAVVGRVLPSVFYTGMVAGLVVIASQWSQRAGWSWRGPETAGAVMILACAVAQLVIAPRIERVRQAIGGPIDALAIGDPQRIAFGRLHGFSVGWLGLAMLAAVAALILAVRAIDKP